jgi:hypothetical protein
MDWVESKSIRGLRPQFAEIFVVREPFEGLESSCEVIGFDEVGQVRIELFAGVVEVALLEPRTAAGSIYLKKGHCYAAAMRN